MKKLYIVFFLLIIVAFCFLFVFRRGWYPLALVNGQLLWGFAYDRTYATVEKYYTNEASTYHLPGLSGRDQDDQLKSDLSLATLNTIIDNMLIADGFYEVIGDTGDTLIHEKISTYLDDEKIQSAASALFNLSISDFRDSILVPQARREIIADVLRKESKEFDTWLNDRRDKADVSVFVREYEWTPDGVRTRP